MHSENVTRPAASPIEQRYDIVTERLEISGREFSMHVVRDVNALLDAITPDAFNVDERLPFWAELWPSSIALAGFCLSGEISGKRVLELGCGLGLAGIAAVRAGARVVMTDYEEDALSFSRKNAEENLTTAEFQRVEFQPLDWRLWKEGETFDAIIGADVVYDRTSFLPVLRIIRTGLAPGGFALLADPGRSIGRDFIEEASRRGMHFHRSSCETKHRAKMTAVDLYRFQAVNADNGENG